MGAVKGFFNHTGVKLAILTGLPMGFSFVTSWYFSGNTNSQPFAKWAVFVLGTLIVFFLWYYGKQETKQKKDHARSEELERRLDEQNQQISLLEGHIAALGDACSTASELSSSCANELYQSIKRKKGHSEIQDWPVVQGKCDQICLTLYELVRKLAYCGDHFSVNFIFKKTQGGVTGFTMLSRKAYKAHAPRLFNDFMPESEVMNYHYKHLFDLGSSRPNFLFTQDEISAVFKKTDGVKYSQYIGIPISCAGNRMVALLQIVAYDDSKLAATREDFEKLYDKYFCMFSSLALLTDKVENANQILK
ncbi:hypothetical protein [Oscillibacter sp.]|uniref:hypothetical protein n=1 Tax=Oscillibacter sp. TaxID=1945593 RepID=UPI001B786F2B|nr:hypothetical protein [Oscillibacter sp.]MBP3509420.1 hypothetical protein [Oscillibacter sp.]